VRSVFASLLVLAFGACVTPSIPVPPPDASQMTFDVDTTGGTATFSYPATTNLGGGVIYVFNRNVGQGVIDTAHADGSIGPTPPFPALTGDEIDVSFQVEDQVVSTCVKLGAGSPATLGFCGT
jgi:hypothetical protein